MKAWLRRWLGIDVAPGKDGRDADTRAIEGKLSRISNQLTTAMAQVMVAEQKADLLAEILGVIVVADMSRNPPSATVQGITDMSFFGDAPAYVESAVVADRIVNAHMRMIQDVNALMDGISWRGRTRPSRLQVPQRTPI